MPKNLDIQTSRYFVFSREMSSFSFQGKDAEKFLQGLMTQNIHKISDPCFARTLFPKSNGKIVFEGYLKKEEGMYRLRIPPRFRETAKQYFDFFHIREELEILENTPETLHFLFSHENSPLLDSLLPLFKSSRNGLTVWESLPDEIPDLYMLNNEEEYDQIRPRFSHIEVHDLPESYPAELGLSACVSYDKGCYIGQEPIARMHLKGKAMKQICTLTSAEPLQKEEAVICEGQKAGNVVLASSTPFEKCYHSMALIKTRYRDSKFQTSFTTESGVSVRPADF